MWAGWNAWFAEDGALSAGLMMGSPDFDICETIALTNTDGTDEEAEGGEVLCGPLEGEEAVEGGTEKVGLEDEEETAGGRWEGEGDLREGGAGG